MVWGPLCKEPREVRDSRLDLLLVQVPNERSSRPVMLISGLAKPQSIANCDAVRPAQELRTAAQHGSLTASSLSHFELKFWKTPLMIFVDQRRSPPLSGFSHLSGRVPTMEQTDVWK